MKRIAFCILLVAVSARAEMSNANLLRNTQQILLNLQIQRQNDAISGNGFRKLVELPQPSRPAGLSGPSVPYFGNGFDPNLFNPFNEFNTGFFSLSKDNPFYPSIGSRDFGFNSLNNGFNEFHPVFNGFNNEFLAPLGSGTRSPLTEAGERVAEILKSLREGAAPDQLEKSLSELKRSLVIAESRCFPLTEEKQAVARLAGAPKAEQVRQLEQLRPVLAAAQKSCAASSADSGAVHRSSAGAAAPVTGGAFGYSKTR